MVNKFKLGDRVKIRGNGLDDSGKIGIVVKYEDTKKFPYTVNFQEDDNVFRESELELLTDDQPEVKKIEKLHHTEIDMNNVGNTNMLKRSSSSLSEVIDVVNELVDFCNALNSKEEKTYCLWCESINCLEPLHAGALRGMREKENLKEKPKDWENDFVKCFAGEVSWNTLMRIKDFIRNLLENK